MAKKEAPPTVTEQLKEAIRNSGQSLNQLSKASGVGSDRLSRFMTGKRGLTGEAIDKLCSALGLRLTADPDAPPAEARGSKKSKGNN
jgi:plasmid maintenance system antidote protein VapI